MNARLSDGIRIEGARKRFETEGKLRPVLNVREFHIGRGEQVALCGPSGSGKTTLLNLISGTLLPESGEVLVNGICVSALSEPDRDAFRLANIGYIFQTYNLIAALTALENVEIVRMFAGAGVGHRDRALQLLDMVGLKDKARRFPHELSCGEQQRVAVARALAADPAVLLADEPTANLDPSTARELMRNLRSLCRDAGKTLVVVTHDAAVASELKVVRIETINKLGASA